MSDERDDEPGAGAAPSAEREGRGILPEGVRRALVSGLSAVLMTEEGIRGALSEMRLPKEAMGYVVAQTERSRRELFRLVEREVKNMLRGTNLHREIRTVLTGLKLKVRAEVSFVAADGDAAARDGGAGPDAPGPAPTAEVEVVRRRRRPPA